MALVVVAVAVGIAVIVVVAVGTAADVEVLANSSFRPMLDGAVAALAGLVVVTEGFSDASVLTTMT